MTKHSALHPHTVFFCADGDAQFDLRELYCLFRLCQTPADFAIEILWRECVKALLFSLSENYFSGASANACHVV